MKNSMPNPTVESRQNHCKHDKNVMTSSTSNHTQTPNLHLASVFSQMVSFDQRRNPYFNIHNNNNTNCLQFDLTLSLITFGKMKTTTQTALGDFIYKFFSVCSILKFSMCSVLKFSNWENVEWNKYCPGVINLEILDVHKLYGKNVKLLVKRIFFVFQE